MKLGLRGKVVLIAISTVLVGLFAVLATSAYVFNGAYVASLQSRSVAIAQGVRLQLDRILQLGIRMEDLVGFEKQCKSFVEAYEGLDFVMVVDREENILFHSESARQGIKLTDPDLIKAVSGKSESTSSYSSDGVRGYGTLVPIFAPDGAFLGAVIVGVSASVVDDKLRPLLFSTFAVGVVFLVAVALIILLTLSHFVMRPLQFFLQSIEQLREDPSQLNRRITWDSADELGQLAHSFNGLLERLQETTVTKSSLESAYSALQDSEADNRRQKALLDTVLNNVDARVYMKDVDGRYLYANASTAAMLRQSQESVIGKRDSEIMLGKEAQRMALMERRMIESKQRVASEEVFKDAAGMDRHYWIMQIPVTDRDRVVASVGISTDITEIVQLKEKFEFLANTDPLTGISNRRHFMAEAERELKRTLRDGKSMAVLIFDIDKFKAINDVYGHAVGDRAILLVVEACKRSGRETDLFARFGGDEFIMVLPGSDATEALVFAERLRFAVAALLLTPNEGALVSLSISIGLAMSDAGSSLDEVIQLADIALYEAKFSGRNRVVQHVHSQGLNAGKEAESATPALKKV